jgi:hypothetical protein
MFIEVSSMLITGLYARSVISAYFCWNSLYSEYLSIFLYFLRNGLFFSKEPRSRTVPPMFVLERSDPTSSLTELAIFCQSVDPNLIFFIVLTLVSHRALLFCLTYILSLTNSATNFLSLNSFNHLSLSNTQTVHGSVQTADILQTPS